LQASSKRFNLLLLPLDNRLLLLVFAVLFKELVEQHRVYGAVAHRVGFAIFVASHQIGANLFYFLGNESEVEWTRRIMPPPDGNYPGFNTQRARTPFLVSPPAKATSQWVRFSA
jgi:hypothetical protein